MNKPTESANTLRCWVEVEMDALRHNASAIRGRTSAGLMAVVKANAYGHGTANVVRAVGDAVAMFGVANLKEAREVRSVCPDRPVFILGPALPCEREAIAKDGFIPAVSSAVEAREYSAHGTLKLHLAIDTGMGRMGVWKEQALETAREILALPGAQLDGVCSHLSCADSDSDFTARQLADFRSLAAEITAISGRRLCVHVENSAATLTFPADAGDMVRCGLALYGIPPVPGFQEEFRPALSWKTRVVLVREMEAGRGVSYGRTFVTSHRTTVATLAVGYADGYPRELSGKGADVVIDGRRCPVIGRITMDQIMVDVTGIGPVRPGDEALLLGSEIPVTELAQKAHTIPWDILTGIGQRVTRIAI